MNLTPIELRFLLSIISQLHHGAVEKESKALHADAYARVQSNHPSAALYLDVLTKKTLEAVDNTLASPVISEEARVRAQTIKDTFKGIKEKLSHVPTKQSKSS